MHKNKFLTFIFFLYNTVLLLLLSPHLCFFTSNQARSQWSIPVRHVRICEPFSSSGWRHGGYTVAAELIKALVKSGTSFRRKAKSIKDKLHCLAPQSARRSQWSIHQTPLVGSAVSKAVAMEYPSYYSLMAWTFAICENNPARQSITEITLYGLL